MKKVMISLLLMAAPMTIFAQMKIISNGNVGFHTTATPVSKIALNYAGNSDFYMAYYGQKRFVYSSVNNATVGSSFQLTPPSNNTVSRTLNIYSRPFSAQNSNSLSIGAWCSSEGGPYTYAALGTIAPTTAGAGIVGSASTTVPSVSMMDHAYAGFFLGDVKITSNLTVSGSINGTVLGPSASISEPTLQTQSMRRENVSELLSQLEATSFRYNNNSQGRTATTESVQIDDSTSIIMALEDEQNLIGKQGQGKTHYALDAAQLERVLPDLIYELNDGSKAVNYVEIIPLLVQSVRELTTRLAALEGDMANDALLSRSTNITDIATTATTGNLLYQNTPNPFKEKTVIRFRLADDATDAAICIFDLTGKQLKKLPISSGETSVSVNGWELGEGMFLYTLLVNGQEIDTKRMIITK
jgi:hypothetical protein